MRRLALATSFVLVAACGRTSLFGEPDLPSGSAGGSAGGSVAGGAGGGGETIDPCRTLGVGACRADARCAPDFCSSCSCRPTFVQCRLKTTKPAQCPALGCPPPQCCSDDSACGRPLLCLDATFSNCGQCDPAPRNCTSDAICNPSGTGNVCLLRPCACSGQTACLPGCSAQNPCPDGETCNLSTRRCARTTCSTTPCPSGLDCVLGPTGNVCVARSCTTDLDCGDLFCVSGTCRTSLGVCNQVVP